jgi:hypothetical protein
LVPPMNESLGAKLGPTYRNPPRRPSGSNGGVIAERIDLTVEHRGSGSVEEWVLFGGPVRGVSRPHEVPSILTSTIGLYDHLPLVFGLRCEVVHFGKWPV